MLGLKNSKAKGVVALLAASALILTGCAAGSTSTTGATTPAATGETSTETKKFVIGFSEPLAGQAWRETGLAALVSNCKPP
jgi:ribose transport system substrate-binding protein